MPSTSFDPSTDSAFLLEAGGREGSYFEGAVQSACNLGFDYVGYLVVYQVGSAWRFVISGNHPRPWLERYLRRNYHVIDPTIAYARQEASPLVWSRELYAGKTLAPLARDTLAIGLNHGWTQPLHQPGGGFGVLTLARRGGLLTESELEAKLPMMQWLARAVHERLFDAYKSWQRNAAIGCLTERELTCLRLAAEGGTAGEIAMLAGVGERTVNFHMANAIEKLGAANKTHAVALALRLGLLD